MREFLLNVEVIESLKDNYICLLVNYHESSAFVVDPGEAPPVLSWLKKRKIVGIVGLDTIVITVSYTHLTAADE